MNIPYDNWCQHCKKNILLYQGRHFCKVTESYHYGINLQAPTEFEYKTQRREQLEELSKEVLIQKVERYRLSGVLTTSTNPKSWKKGELINTLIHLENR